ASRRQRDRGRSELPASCGASACARSCRYKAGRRRWVGGIDQAHFGGLVIVHAEQEETPILCCAEAEKVTGVILLMDNFVGSVGAHQMPQHTPRTVLLVKPDVDKRAAVGRPFERTVVVGDT